LAQKIDEVVSLNIPFVIGEFSGKSLGCTDESPYLTVLEKCHEHGIGWLAWEWGPGNEFAEPPDKPCPEMNMTTDGKYSSIQDGWARTVAIDHPYSIKNTAVTPHFLVQGGE
jgi:mannan endo-1,4-beta-mannosidase